MSQIWALVPPEIQPRVIAAVVLIMVIGVLALIRYALTTRFRDAFARAMQDHYLAPAGPEGFRMSPADSYQQVWRLVRVWWLPGRFYTHLPHSLIQGVSDSDIKAAAAKAAESQHGDWQNFVYHVGWGVWVLSDGRSQ